MDFDELNELDELDRPPVGCSSVAAERTFDDWVSKIPYALGALVASFMVFPVLFGSPIGPGVALLTSSAAAWFFLGRSAPRATHVYLLAVAGPVSLLVLLLS